MFFFLKIHLNSDSDSDFVNEQLTGNIHKIAIVPPNFAGRPKKGHLIFDEYVPKHAHQPVEKLHVPNCFEV